MSTDIKLSKSHLAKIIQTGGCLSKMMINLSKEALIDFVVTMAKNILFKLAIKAALSAIGKLKKISRRGAVRAGKRFTLFISKDMGDIIKIH